jgi:hypothetical protein
MKNLWSPANLYFYAPDETWRSTIVGGNTESWKHIVIDLKINSSSGYVGVWKDGDQITNTTSINTGSGTVNNIAFGHFGGSGDTPTYWDDIYIDDMTGETTPTIGPILRFYPLTPNGNGNYAQFDGSDGNSVDNYLLVDERPPGTSDYVQTNVVDEYDSYQLTSYTLATGETVEAIIPIIYGIRYGNSEQIALGTRYSSTDLIGSDQNLATSYTLGTYRWERQTTKPGGGAWDQTSMDGAELVIKSRGSY